LIAGRNFIVRDSVAEFVVNEEFMRKVGIRDPLKIIGKQLEDGNSGLKGEIVGVVKSFHLKSLQSAIEPCAIFSKPNLYKEIAIRLHPGDLPAVLKTIQTIWLKSYPYEVFSYQFVDERIAKFYEKEKQLTGLIQTFALLAIVICALGLYGMISFMVGQKTKEIGIRKVLGAGVENIALLFGREFLALVFVSFVIASPVAWYAMQAWLSDFAYRIEIEWWMPLSGGLFIIIVTMLTVGRKVTQAAMMDPVRSLKTD
jgi:putative ABC transport system permease protein